MKKTLIALVALLALAGGAAYASDIPAWKGNEAFLKNGFWGKGLGREVMMNIKAEVLGMSLVDLKAEFDSGKSFADILSEKGMSFETWRTSVQQRITAQLAQMVNEGKITQAQADKIAERNAERLGNCNGEGPKGWQTAIGSGQGLKKGLRGNLK